MDHAKLVIFLLIVWEIYVSSSTIDGSMRMKNSSEPSSPLSPEVFPARAFIKEGPVQLSSVSVSDLWLSSPNNFSVGRRLFTLK